MRKNDFCAKLVVCICYNPKDLSSIGQFLVLPVDFLVWPSQELEPCRRDLWGREEDSRTLRTTQMTCISWTSSSASLSSGSLWSSQAHRPHFMKAKTLQIGHKFFAKVTKNETPPTDVLGALFKSSNQARTSRSQTATSRRLRSQQSSGKDRGNDFVPLGSPFSLSSTS